MFFKAANLGDAKSTISHPASTPHGRLTDDQRAAAGIKEGLIRLSVGLGRLRLSARTRRI